MIKYSNNGWITIKYLKMLKDLREDNDLTQNDIAKILQTTTQYYPKYETAKRPLTIERLEILVDYCNTSTDYILGRTDIKRPYSEITNNV